MFHPFCRSTGERPPTERVETAFGACLRRWFSQYRKTFLGDELYSPSCQRLTRPAPFLPPCSRRFSPRSAPRRALAKHCLDTSTRRSFCPRGNLIYCPPVVSILLTAWTVLAPLSFVTLCGFLKALRRLLLPSVEKVGESGVREDGLSREEIRSRRDKVEHELLGG